MSYDVELVDPNTKERYDVPYFDEGGTRILGGHSESWLNITYNYAQFYYDKLDNELGIRWLYGKTGQETISRLENAILQLGIEKHRDYWKPTPGNAGFALSILLRWAKQCPMGIWQGD